MTLLNLKPNLLESVRETCYPLDDLTSYCSPRGQYSPLQFVLRLSPDVHRLLSPLPMGIINNKLDHDTLQAFSTYLHETVHWWQHIGSTAGFVRSMSFPAQSHVNFKHLKHLLNTIGPKKSIRQLAERLPVSNSPETSAGRTNVVVNNHFDIEFYRFITHTPASARTVVESPYFECIGHSFGITYANVLLVLASTCDESFSTLPDPRPWEKEFANLRNRKEEGYYHGSDFRIAELGVQELFEGQARFAQLQYLYFATGGNLTWDAARSAGMLNGIYIKAFEAFLRGTELTWPPSIDHPIVALFMLLCDIALNPGEGFPMPIVYPASFFTDTDPGMRFVFLCRVVATQCPSAAHAITSYSRSEYHEVADALTRPLLIQSPLSIAEELGKWTSRSFSLQSLMKEYENFDFDHRNQAIRLLFAHFLSFYSDKLARPEVFCWPGAWMAGNRLSSDIPNLFERHSALFVDKPEDKSIFPRLVTGKDESLVHAAFESFYAFNVSYDMTRQWVVRSGPFRYDYHWLSSSASPDDCKGFADRHFEMIYGVAPDTFEILESV